MGNSQSASKDRGVGTWNPRYQSGNPKQAKVFLARNRHQTVKVGVPGANSWKKEGSAVRPAAGSSPVLHGSGDFATDAIRCSVDGERVGPDQSSLVDLKRSSRRGLSGRGRIEVGESKSGQGRARTADTGLFRAVLYQLSYLTVIDSNASAAGNLKSSRSTSRDQFDAERS